MTGGGVYGQCAGREHAAYGGRDTLGHGDRLADGRYGVFWPVVLAVAIVPRISDCRGQRVGMALDRSGVLGARVQRGAAMRVGFWMDRPRNARTGGSPEETRRGGVLSIRAESNVLGFFWGMGRAVGGLWPCEFATDLCGSGCGPVRCSIRQAV